MKKIFLFAFVFLSACKNSFWYTDLYTRKSGRLKHVAEKYYEFKEVELGLFHLCYFYNPSGITRSEVGNLHLDAGEIVDSVLDSYGENFKSFTSRESNISVSNTNCLINTKESIKYFQQRDHSISGKNRVQLYSQLSIIVESHRHLQGGGGMELTEDMGNDRHKLEYFLITTLMQYDSIVYLDNRIHWTEVFSERGEQLKYEVPQTVIDSLVSLSLEEYFNRVTE